VKEIKNCKDNLSVSVFKTDAACHRNIDGIAVERVAGSTDEVILRELAGLAICVLTREARIYRRVCAALERLAAGTFGSCLHCDESISDQRLQALLRAGALLDVPGSCGQRAPTEERPPDLAVVGCSLTKRVVCQ
jgi:RNA polymerase-binding transcription factor DksA